MARRTKHWIILNREGQARYGEVFEAKEVPVLSMVPIFGRLGGKKEQIYLIYHEELTEPALDRMVKWLAKRFQADEKTIRDQMNTVRIPMQAKYVAAAGTDHLEVFT